MINKKKKILILTSIYPGPDIPKNFTPVVHYFVKEWIKIEDLDIKVIHLPAYFHKFLYLIPNTIKDFVSSRLGFPFPKKRLSDKIDYIYEGVSVSRIPIYKNIPMSNFSGSILKDTSEEIIKMLDREHFKPDLILGHWFNPQVFISAYLKKHYDCPTIITLHEATDKYKNDKQLHTVINLIDKWGYRNKKIQQNFLQNFGLKPTIHCLSGIPENFGENPPKKDFTNLKNFVFVGGLLKRKYPDVVIKALLSSYSNEEFSLEIVGDGPMKSELKNLIDKENANSHIIMPGRKTRQEIIPILDYSDVFVMISKDEAFGLVYIEAMARGCIVIASKNEGMEGIINHGLNGFLCEAGNQKELESIIQMIRQLPASTLKTISSNAILTASELTDAKVARKYLTEILSI